MTDDLVEKVARQIASMSDCEGDDGFRACIPEYCTCRNFAKAAIAIIRPAVLQQAAEVAKAHKGSAAKKRIARGQRLSMVDEAAWPEITAEERGEDIAAEMIEAAILALAEPEKNDD